MTDWKCGYCGTILKLDQDSPHLAQCPDCGNTYGDTDD